MIRHGGVRQFPGQLGEVNVAGEQAGVAGGRLRNPAQVDHGPIDFRRVAALAVQPPVAGQFFVIDVDAQLPVNVAIRPGANHVVGVSVQAFGIPEGFAHHQAAAAGRDVEQEVRVGAFELDDQFVVADDFGAVQVNAAPVVGVTQQGIFPRQHFGAVENVLRGELAPIVVVFHAFDQLERPAGSVLGQFPTFSQLGHPDVLLGVNVHQHFHDQVHLLVVVNGAAPGEVGFARRRVNGDYQGINFHLALLLRHRGGSRGWRRGSAGRRAESGRGGRRFRRGRGCGGRSLNCRRLRGSGCGRRCGCRRRRRAGRGGFRLAPASRRDQQQQDYRNREQKAINAFGCNHCCCPSCWRDCEAKTTERLRFVAPEHDGRQFTGLD